MPSRRPCEAGYFCPLGSATARAKQCGSIGSACPQGSKASETPHTDNPSRTVGHTVRPHCQLLWSTGVLNCLVLTARASRSRRRCRRCATARPQTGTRRREAARRFSPRPEQGEHENRKSPAAAAALRGMWPFAQSCSPPYNPGVQTPSFCGYVMTSVKRYPI